MSWNERVAERAAPGTFALLAQWVQHAFAPAHRSPGWLVPRWLWLRALGLIFLSAFYSLAFQVRGLIGERGILPAGEYLAAVASAAGPLERFWAAPTLFWLSASDRMLMAVVLAGALSAVLLVLDVWPRLTTAACWLAFLSCIAALQDFSSYQSDGMLLEAGLISVFLAPRGLRPRLGAADPPSRASLFLLQWEWFRIYFESGVVKLASGDPHWRNLTAMDEYYQNGPLPTWLGWHVQHFPHWYHAGTVLLTFAVELVIVWALFLPRPFRLVCAAVVSALQAGIIATANYAFLNYLVLALGLLLLDDGLFEKVGLRVRGWGLRLARRLPSPATSETGTRNPQPATPAWHTWISAVVLSIVGYATIPPALLPGPLALPQRLLDPFRVANQYGLFAVMTEGRYEVEFQGTRDGVHWVAYPFRYKPQDPMERPGIYAPYQPRFDWNLWFASLGPWRASPWVVAAQARLIERSPTVLALVREDPFHGEPPVAVRTVLWQYWFTDAATKRRTGAWWRRELVGGFSGVVTREEDGKMSFTEAR